MCVIFAATQIFMPAVIWLERFWCAQFKPIRCFKFGDSAFNSFCFICGCSLDVGLAQWILQSALKSLEKLSFWKLIEVITFSPYDRLNYGEEAPNILTAIIVHPQIILRWFSSGSLHVNSIWMFAWIEVDTWWVCQLIDTRTWTKSIFKQMAHGYYWIIIWLWAIVAANSEVSEAFSLCV